MFNKRDVNIKICESLNNLVADQTRLKQKHGTQRHITSAEQQSKILFAERSNVASEQLQMHVD